MERCSEVAHPEFVARSGEHVEEKDVVEGTGGFRFSTDSETRRARARLGRKPHCISHVRNVRVARMICQQYVGFACSPNLPASSFTVMESSICRLLCSLRADARCVVAGMRWDDRESL